MDRVKSQKIGQAIFVVGLQYGDEGKGKIVDLLAQNVSAVVRGNGGSNAGHTIVLDSGVVAALHQLPSGIAYAGKQNIIGHGVLLDPVRLVQEMEDVGRKGIKLSPRNLVISDMAHMVLPKHKLLDAARESGEKAQGSTKAGIAYAASDKSLREGIRAEAIVNRSKKELFEIARQGLQENIMGSAIPGFPFSVNTEEAFKLAEEFAESAISLKPFIKDTPSLLNKILDDGENILIEGAQAYGLDVNHGKYPFSTSTGTTVPALIDGTGINIKRAGTVVGVVKATPSKVGGGSFVTRIDDDKIASNTRGKKGEVDGEYGATTGRQREVGYLDLVMLKRAVLINGVDEIALTKFDCIKRHGRKTKIAVAYEHKTSGKKLLIPPNCDEDLQMCKPIYKEFPTWENDSSKAALDYLKFIEEYLETKITIVSNGPERNQIILR